MNNLPLPLLLGVCLATPSISQTFENLRNVQDGQNIIVTYDLNYPDASQTFKVNLYSSFDDYIKPLNEVAGDVGNNVTPGKGHRIVWKAAATLPADFDRELTFKVKGVMNLTLSSLEGISIKRGNSKDIIWRGGTVGDKINLELIQKDIVVTQLVDKAENNKSFTWSTSKKLKPGKDYQIRLTNAIEPTEVSMSGPFTVKRRIPLWAKGLVIAGVGVAIWQLSIPPEDPDLPAIKINPND